MSVGAGVITQARLRPIRTVVNGTSGNGGGINYGMGIGAVRIAGVTYSIFDSSLTYNMKAQSFVARVAIVNGNYANSAQIFSPTTDLTAYDVLFDATIGDAGPTMLPTWESGLVSDDGLNVTALISQIIWPTGGGPPAGILPVSTLVLHADHYKNKELALSPGIAFVDATAAGGRGLLG